MVIKVNPGITGKILKEDVHLENGEILFEKGYKLSMDDLQFLDAFKIETIKVEYQENKLEYHNKESNQHPPEKSSIQKEKDSFSIQYEQAVIKMERIMRNVGSGAPIPLLDIRGWLKPLIDQLHGPTGWLKALQPTDRKERYIYHHSIGVALLASVLARTNHLPENEIMQIALAGLLSDIGKVRLDEGILLKTGPLTEKEFEEMKHHTIYGYRILKDTTGLSEGVALAALQHHEREDGNGYPLGIKGEQIHPYAKIVAIADVFHAMSSLRSYKEAESPYRVMEYLRYEDFNRFDPGIIHNFIKMATQVPLGTEVRLNDGRYGKIVFIDGRNPARPIVNIFGETISLFDHKHLYIQDIFL